MFLRYLIGLVIVGALSYAAVSLLGLPRGLIPVLTVVVAPAIAAWVILDFRS